MPSSNRLSNRKNQPRDRNVSAILCELPTGWLNKLASCYKIPVQWQKTCSNRKDSIWIKLWKTFLERGPHSTNGDSTSQRIPYWITKELGISDKSNGESTKEHEMAIWQEKKKPSRTEDWQPYVVGKQEYLIESTLKEVGQ